MNYINYKESEHIGYTKLHCLNCGYRFDIPDNETYEKFENRGENLSEADRCPKCKSDDVNFGF